MDARSEQLTGTAACHECGEVATRRMTVDIDIRGLPICDSSVCEHKARVRLMMIVFAGSEDEAERFANMDMEGLKTRE